MKQNTSLQIQQYRKMMARKKVIKKLLELASIIILSVLLTLFIMKSAREAETGQKIQYYIVGGQKTFEQIGPVDLLDTRVMPMIGLTRSDHIQQQSSEFDIYENQIVSYSKLKQYIEIQLVEIKYELNSDTKYYANQFVNCNQYYLDQVGIPADQLGRLKASY